MYDRILIVRPGALGDFVLTLPVIAGLRELYPKAWIEVLARGRAASLADGLANKTGNLDIRRPAPAASSNYIVFFDLVITWSSGSFSPYLPEGYGGRAVTVPAVPGAGVSASLFFFRSVPQLRGAAWRPPRVRPAAEEAAEADRILEEDGLAAGRPVAAVHPGSGARRKCWPGEHFARAIRALLNTGHQVVILEGEADAQAVADVCGELGARQVPVLRDLPPRMLAAVLSRCDRYLGNDSGVSHVAAAAGARCTLIFGPTDPAVWAPVGPNVEVLAADLACRPCGKTSPNCATLRCLSDITPDRVLDAVLR